MMRRIVPGFALLLLACGGRFDETQARAKLVGSYELTFGTVTTVDNGSPRPCCGGPVRGASTGQRARLDIADDGSGNLRATLTAEWGSTGELDVTVTSGKALLGGAATVTSGTPGGSATDTWRSIEIPLGTDGAPTGAVSLAGDEMVTSGDVGWGTQITATATLAKDTIAPDVRVSSGAGFADELLPWEEALLSASEPLDPSAWAASVSTSSRLDWKADATSWSGATLLHGVRPTWDGGATVRLSVAPNKDRSGNASPTTSFDVHYLDLGAPRAAFDFGGPSVASWGAVVPRSDATCEGGACLDIGPAKVGYCATERAGFAGRLTVTGKKAIVLRYRAEYTPSAQWGAQQPPGQPLVALELATPGGSAARSQLPDLTMTPAQDKTWRSDWVTARLPVPSGAQEVGFALRTGGEFGGCNFGPYPADMGSARVIVQSVSAE